MRSVTKLNLLRICQSILALLVILTGCSKLVSTKQPSIKVNENIENNPKWGSFYLRTMKMDNDQPWPEFENPKTAPWMQMGLQKEIENDRTGWVQVNQKKMTIPKIHSNQQIRLQTSPYTANHLEVIADLDVDRLYRLDLNDLEDQDQLYHITNLIQLKVLDMQEANLNDEGIVHLAGLKSLEALNLDDTYIGDSGLSHLTDLTNLRVIRLRETNVGDIGLMYLKKHSQLEELAVPFFVGDKGMLALANLVKLKFLDLQSSQISDTGLSVLANLRSLQILDLSHTRIYGKGLSYLKSCDLKSLNLSFVPLQGQFLVHLSVLNNLEKLQMNRTPVDDEGLAYLANLKNLRQLELKNSRVTGPGIEFLTGIKTLESLNLESCGVTDEIANHLSRLKNLRELNLFQTEVTEKTLAELSKMPNLQDLSLGGFEWDLETVPGQPQKKTYSYN